MGASKRQQMLAPGVSAPEFALRDPGGSIYTLSGILARGPVLLAFFKVSCPVCQFTFPFLERLYQGAGRGGALQIIGISQDDARATREFNEEFGVSFPTLVDEASDRYPVSNAFGISSVPTLFLIEPGGNISMSGSGFSKTDLQAVGDRVGVAPFRSDERIPDLRPG